MEFRLKVWFLSVKSANVASRVPTAGMSSKASSGSDSASASSVALNQSAKPSSASATASAMRSGRKFNAFYSDGSKRKASAIKCIPPRSVIVAAAMQVTEVKEQNLIDDGEHRER